MSNDYIALMSELYDNATNFIFKGTKEPSNLTGFMSKDDEVISIDDVNRRFLIEDEGVVDQFAQLFYIKDGNDIIALRTDLDENSDDAEDIEVADARLNIIQNRPEFDYIKELVNSNHLVKQSGGKPDMDEVSVDDYEQADDGDDELPELIDGDDNNMDLDEGRLDNIIIFSEQPDTDINNIFMINIKNDLDLLESTVMDIDSKFDDDFPSDIETHSDLESDITDFDIDDAEFEYDVIVNLPESQYVVSNELLYETIFNSLENVFKAPRNDRQRREDIKKRMNLAKTFVNPRNDNGIVSQTKIINDLIDKYPAVSKNPVIRKLAGIPVDEEMVNGAVQDNNWIIPIVVDSKRTFMINQDDGSHYFGSENGGGLEDVVDLFNPAYSIKRYGEKGVGSRIANEKEKLEIEKKAYTHHQQLVKVKEDSLNAYEFIDSEKEDGIRVQFNPKPNKRGDIDLENERDLSDIYPELVEVARYSTLRSDIKLRKSTTGAVRIVYETVAGESKIIIRKEHITEPEQLHVIGFIRYPKWSKQNFDRRKVNYQTVSLDELNSGSIGNWDKFNSHTTIYTFSRNDKVTWNDYNLLLKKIIPSANNLWDIYPEEELSSFGKINSILKNLDMSANHIPADKLQDLQSSFDDEIERTMSRYKKKMALIREPIRSVRGKKVDEKSISFLFRRENLELLKDVYGEYPDYDTPKDSSINRLIWVTNRLDRGLCFEKLIDLIAVRQFSKLKVSSAAQLSKELLPKIKKLEEDELSYLKKNQSSMDILAKVERTSDIIYENDIPNLPKKFRTFIWNGESYVPSELYHIQAEISSLSTLFEMGKILESRKKQVKNMENSAMESFENQVKKYRVLSQILSDKQKKLTSYLFQRRKVSNIEKIIMKAAIDDPVKVKDMYIKLLKDHGQISADGKFIVTSSGSTLCCMHKYDEIVNELDITEINNKYGVYVSDTITCKNCFESMQTEYDESEGFTEEGGINRMHEGFMFEDDEDNTDTITATGELKEFLLFAKTGKMFDFISSVLSEDVNRNIDINGFINELPDNINIKSPFEPSTSFIENERNKIKRTEELKVVKALKRKNPNANPKQIKKALDMNKDVIQKEVDNALKLIVLSNFVIRTGFYVAYIATEIEIANPFVITHDKNLLQELTGFFINHFSEFRSYIGEREIEGVQGAIKNLSLDQKYNNATLKNLLSNTASDVYLNLRSKRRSDYNIAKENHKREVAREDILDVREDFEVKLYKEVIRNPDGKISKKSDVKSLHNNLDILTSQYLVNMIELSQVVYKIVYEQIPDNSSTAPRLIRGKVVEATPKDNIFFFNALSNHDDRTVEISNNDPDYPNKPRTSYTHKKLSELTSDKDRNIQFEITKDIKKILNTMDNLSTQIFELEKALEEKVRDARTSFLMNSYDSENVNRTTISVDSTSDNKKVTKFRQSKFKKVNINTKCKHRVDYYINKIIDFVDRNSSEISNNDVLSSSSAYQFWYSGKLESTLKHIPEIQIRKVKEMENELKFSGLMKIRNRVAIDKKFMIGHNQKLARSLSRRIKDIWLNYIHQGVMSIQNYDYDDEDEGKNRYFSTLSEEEMEAISYSGAEAFKSYDFTAIEDINRYDNVSSSEDINAMYCKLLDEIVSNIDNFTTEAGSVSYAYFLMDAFNKITSHIDVHEFSNPRLEAYYDEHQRKQYVAMRDSGGAKSFDIIFDDDNELEPSGDTVDMNNIPVAIDEDGFGDGNY